ncbi:MAG: transcriptional regulator of arginine metabolism [Planctomycetota bacterium]|jgi:transcriptional regulator of arginine metabolism
MTQAKERRAAVRALLEDSSVSSQSDLLEMLEEKGIAATQPALSRDMRALGVAKVEGVYRIPERVTPLDKLASLLRGAVPAGDHMLVLHCEPGAASAVSRALEAEEPEGLIGSVAGDDTIFLAVASAAEGARIQRRVLALVG